jgi:hypothetical protein
LIEFNLTPFVYNKQNPNPTLLVGADFFIGIEAGFMQFMQNDFFFLTNKKTQNFKANAFVFVYETKDRKFDATTVHWTMAFS